MFSLLIFKLHSVQGTAAMMVNLCSVINICLTCKLSKLS